MIYKDFLNILCVSIQSTSKLNNKERQFILSLTFIEGLNQDSLVFRLFFHFIVLSIQYYIEYLLIENLVCIQTEHSVSFLYYLNAFKF
jgi:hypothetical protein